MRVRTRFNLNFLIGALFPVINLSFPPTTRARSRR